jgi:hypothetical protein
VTVIGSERSKRQRDGEAGAEHHLVVGGDHHQVQAPRAEAHRLPGRQLDVVQGDHRGDAVLDAGLVQLDAERGVGVDAQQLVVPVTVLVIRSTIWEEPASGTAACASDTVRAGSPDGPQPASAIARATDMVSTLVRTRTDLGRAGRRLDLGERGSTAADLTASGDVQGAVSARRRGTRWGHQVARSWAARILTTKVGGKSSA